MPYRIYRQESEKLDRSACGPLYQRAAECLHHSRAAQRSRPRAPTFTLYSEPDRAQEPNYSPPYAALCRDLQGLDPAIPEPGILPRELSHRIDHRRIPLRDDRLATHRRTPYPEHRARSSKRDPALAHVRDLLTTNTRAHHHPDRSQRGTGSGQRGSGKYEVEVIITYCVVLPCRRRPRRGFGRVKWR